MTNWKLIEKSIKLVIDLFEAEGIMEDSKVIVHNVMTWYNKTDVTDAEMLAAAAISGPYRFGTSWDELIDLKEFYFPADLEKFGNPAHEEELMLDSYSIEEIESAQNDFLYW